MYVGIGLEDNRGCNLETPDDFPLGLANSIADDNIELNAVSNEIANVMVGVELYSGLYNASESYVNGKSRDKYIASIRNVAFECIGKSCSYMTTGNESLGSSVIGFFKKIVDILIKAIEKVIDVTKRIIDKIIRFVKKTFGKEYSDSTGGGGGSASSRATNACNAADAAITSGEHATSGNLNESVNNTVKSGEELLKESLHKLESMFLLEDMFPNNEISLNSILQYVNKLHTVTVDGILSTTISPTRRLMDQAYDLTDPDDLRNGNKDNYISLIEAYLNLRKNLVAGETSLQTNARQTVADIALSDPNSGLIKTYVENIANEYSIYGDMFNNYSVLRTGISGKYISKIAKFKDNRHSKPIGFTLKHVYTLDLGIKRFRDELDLKVKKLLSMYNGSTEFTIDEFLTIITEIIVYKARANTSVFKKLPIKNLLDKKDFDDVIDNLSINTTPNPTGCSNITLALGKSEKMIKNNIRHIEADFNNKLKALEETKNKLSFYYTEIGTTIVNASTASTIVDSLQTALSIQVGTLQTDINTMRGLHTDIITTYTGTEINSVVSNMLNLTVVQSINNN